ncbi:MAG TPA: septum formation initiator family protein [Bryobacteraceae bacterium]|nr:septum formation initiator family protein [Bryobacteraceae bacterium]
MRGSLTKFFFVLLTLLVAGYAFFSLRGGIPALMEKQHEIRDLEQRNADLARQVSEKRERIQRLRESDAEQELEVRQRLKLVRPGEKVFILQDPKGPAAEPRQ